MAATNMSPERRVSWPTTIAPPRADQAVGGRAAERVGEGRLEVDVGDTADPVGAEEAGHRSVSLPTATAASPMARPADGAAS